MSKPKTSFLFTNNHKPIVQGIHGCQLLSTFEAMDRKTAEGGKRSLSRMEEAEKIRQEEIRKNTKDPALVLMYAVKDIQLRGGFGLSGEFDMISRLQPITRGVTELNLSNTPTVDVLVHAMIPYIVSSQCTLRVLKLVKTRISFNGSIALSRAILMNCSLVQLFLTDTPLQIAYFKEMKDQCRNVDFSDCQYDELSAGVLGVLLQYSSNFSSLNLSKNRLTGKNGELLRGIETIAEAVKKSRKVRSIEFRDINLRSDGLLKFCPVIESTLSLDKIDLSDNKLSFNSLDQYALFGVKALCGSLRKNTTIHQVILSNTALTCDAMEHFRDVVMLTTNLWILDLSNNPIGGAGLIHLSEALRHNSSLEKLRLENTEVDCDGVIALSASLRTFNSTLTDIDLSHNSKIRRKGLKSVIDCLHVNSSILKLRITNHRKRYESLVQNVALLVKSNNDFHQVKQNIATFDFRRLKEHSLMNFLAKMSTLDEAQRVNLMRNETFKQIRLSTDEMPMLRYTSTMGEKAINKSILSILSQDHHTEWLCKRNEKKLEAIDDDNNVENDIWDQPLL